MSVHRKRTLPTVSVSHSMQLEEKMTPKPPLRICKRLQGWRGHSWPIHDTTNETRRGKQTWSTFHAMVSLQPATATPTHFAFAENKQGREWKAAIQPHSVPFSCNPLTQNMKCPSSQAPCFPQQPTRCSREAHKQSREATPSAVIAPLANWDL